MRRRHQVDRLRERERFLEDVLGADAIAVRDRAAELAHRLVLTRVLLVVVVGRGAWRPVPLVGVVVLAAGGGGAGVAEVLARVVDE